MASVARYYDRCARDFAAWSPSLYLHFGLYRRGLSPLDRESMLAAMNDAVISRLDLGRVAAPRVLDAGCGVGSVARYLATRHRAARVVGITVVPSQVALGRTLVDRDGLAPRVQLVAGDYARTPLAAASMHAGYAIESLCYAPGDAKEPLVAEMGRILVPGGRFVIADCFRTGSVELPRALRPPYAAMCAGWAIPGLPRLDAVATALRRRGFSRVTVDDVSWQVAPSVAHVPFAVTAFLARSVLADGPLALSRHRERRDNLVAPLLGALLGASRSHFRYCLVTAIRD